MMPGQSGRFGGPNELSHAWVSRNFTGVDRLRFTTLREAATWSSTAYPWEQRSMEHAADILTWALLDLPTEKMRVHPSDGGSLSVALRFILSRSDETLSDPEALVARLSDGKEFFASG